MKSFSFPRKERIKGTTIPSLLYHNGSVISEHPMLCRHLSSHSETGGFQVLFSVPKKKIPKAVDRNRIKRRLREAWRLNAGTLRNTCTSSRVLLQVGIYYQSDVVLPFSDLEAKIKTLIKRLSKHHETSDR